MSRERIVEVKIIERWDDVSERWKPDSICRVDVSEEAYRILLAIIAESSPTKRRYRVAEYTREEEV